MIAAVYLLQSQADGTFYVGSTSDIAKRLAHHNSGGNAFTRSRRPWRIAYAEVYHSSREALRRERSIKKRKSRRYVEELIRGRPFDAGSLPEYNPGVRGVAQLG
ncbi:MAG: GIY-YIG nuclease family protein [Candidatus Brocadiia bacterium]